ncbi:Fur family transcriptional regulator, ferric uptake regulator [Roseovarius marisflavi]|uniref:Ferric uptake regulation protein n=2 Tax=Roseovarius marisflavi TaxID=1054996 RepID=A0A1M6VLI1_9RHOB|nr:Fur family transcriptional regulator, ferric uptake regulator [Roseovarius marisflavi]
MPAQNDAMSETHAGIENLTEALREAGIRVTRQRAALLSVLAAADDHPDAPELHRRAENEVPGISLSTVYRTLSTLESQGVIQRHQFEGAPARFEPVEAGHHDHMIDVETGNVLEFCSDRIEKLQAEIAAELGYEIVHHRMELYVRKVTGPA